MATPPKQPAPAAPRPAGKDTPQAPTANQPDVLMCILSYFGIFSLIPFFIKKDDPYISWHARQGLLLAITCLAAYVALFVVSMIPGIGMIAFLLYGVFGLGVIGISIWCMIQACQGNRWPIPVLSSFMGRIPG